MNPICYNLKKFNESFRDLKSVKGGYKYIPTLFDFLCSAVKYGASASDYFDYEFFNKSGANKKQFVCYSLKRKFFRMMNDYDKRYIFDNKIEFLKAFGEFIGRDWLDMANATENDFLKFARKHKTFIIKTQTGSCGSGVSKCCLDENSNLESLYVDFKSKKCLLEEVIVQHHTMSELYSECINSVRIGAIKSSDGIEMLGACVRCGNGSDCIDNFCGGGIVAKVDPTSGVVISDAVNRLHQRFYKHPQTEVMFHGFKIPHWDLVVSLITDAMNVVDGVRYIGWDVAIRENDVVLIEGNFEGMFNVLQKPADRGIRKELEAIIQRVENEVIK